MTRLLYRLSLTSLVCIYLVVLAGSVVRMTGSGMGCPDWPKCFGYYIPPTDIETLTWNPGREFDKGNVIIKDEALYVAQADFVAGDQFNSSNWAPYTKHDYALFNPTHTWIEFINRLVGAFTGLPVLLLFLFSLRKLKKDPLIPIIAFAGLLLLGFEAWLGKEVVDGNLIPHQITYHMFGAIALVAVYTFLTIRLKPSSLTFKSKRDSSLVWIGILGFVLLLVQVYLGTSVRETVDAIGKAELISTPSWIDELGVSFKIHRTFSLLVLAIVGWFGIRVLRTQSISAWPRVLLVIIVLETLVGVGLAYLNMLAILQPLHLLMAIFELGTILLILFTYFKQTTKS